MKKFAAKVVSCLLMVTMLLSLFPSTAFAGEFDSAILWHTTTIDGKYQNSTSDWAKQYSGILESLHYVVVPDDNGEWTDTQMNQFPGDSIDLWVWSDDMLSDGVANDRTKIPYFYVRNGSVPVAKWRLEKIEIHSGNNISSTTLENETPVVIQNTASSYSITKSDLDAHRDGPYFDDPSGTGLVSIIYVWERVALDDTDPDKELPPIKNYTLRYTLNRGDNDGQLPERVGVSYKGTMNFNVEDTYFTDGSVMEGNTTDLYPLGYPIEVPPDDFKTNDARYGLIGWKCEDPACGTTEDHPLHQVGHEGDTLTAAASMDANEDGVITLSAQWEFSDLPEPEKMASKSSANDPPLYKLGVAKDEEGNTAFITQHTLKDGEPVDSELMMDPENCQIYYEATVQMDEDVASALSGYTVWGGASFAQFQIKVAMDSKLSLVDEDGDGNAEFTFTCPFLRPVQGQEILVDGKAVNGVQVTSEKTVITQNNEPKEIEIGPYTYEVPVSALQDENGIHPFTIVAEWNPAKGSYSKAELTEPITLATAKMTTSSKEDLVTTGTVTGWIDPAASGLTGTMQSNLTSIMLGNSPTLWTYLKNELGLTNQQAAKAMENFLSSDVGKAHCMERSILTANAVGSWVPCVVKFVDEDGNPIEGISDQWIKYQNGAEEPDNMPAFSGGKDFNGWYYRNSAGELVKFNFATDKVTDDMVLIAQWADHTHQYRNDDWVYVDPTCTIAGYRHHTCTVPGCGYEATERTADPLGHDWGEWVTEREASYTETGLRARTCARCSIRDEEIIPMLTPDPVIPPVIPPVTPVTPNIPDNPTPLDPGTNIPDEEVPLANTIGLNDTDHFGGHWRPAAGDGPASPADTPPRWPWSKSPGRKTSYPPGGSFSARQRPRSYR